MLRKYVFRRINILRGEKIDLTTPYMAPKRSPQVASVVECSATLTDFSFPPVPDRETVTGAATLLDQVETSLQRLVQLSATRRRRLEQCLQLRVFEEQASQVGAL